MPAPPLPTALLRLVLPRAERDEVLADLAAEFDSRAACRSALRARAWYWRQAAGSLPALLRRAWWRGRTGFEPDANRMNPGGPAMEQWIMDARHSVRRLKRRPLYATLAVVTLALGIGGTVAVFGIVRTVLFDPLPYADEGNIAVFWMPFDWTQQEFAFLRGRIPGFTSVAQYRPDDATLEIGDAPARLVSGVAASSELFDVLGARPAFGRTFEPRDDVRGAEAVAVISYGLWRELGGDRGVIGQRIVLAGKPTTVVGVMPNGFWFPSPSVGVWVPEQLNPDEDIGNFSLIGRVAPGNRIDRMATPLAQLTGLLAKRFHYAAQWDKTRNPWVRSARESFVGPLRPTLIATFVAMGMILFISCANVAALMLGQVEGRTVELSVRSALGATRGRIANQLLAEALVLGAIAGAVGALLAAASFRWLTGELGLGAWAETASLDWRVFVAAMVLSVGAALTISLAPAVSLWRGRLRGALGAGRTVGVGGRGIRVESVLVIVEVALAVLMTAGAGLLVRSVEKLYAINPGVETHGVGVVDLVLPADLTNDRRMLAVRDIAAALRGVTGVKNAAVVQRLPLRGSAWNSFVEVPGKPNLPRSSTYVRMISAGYLETMGIRLIRGRSFNESDMLLTPADSTSGVVIINTALA
ncbi:MAG: ABC transporter permease, partial [Gemmatimonadales bacterium]